MSALMAMIHDRAGWPADNSQLNAADCTLVFLRIQDGLELLQRDSILALQGIVFHARLVVRAPPLLLFEKSRTLAVDPLTLDAISPRKSQGNVAALTRLAGEIVLEPASSRFRSRN